MSEWWDRYLFDDLIGLEAAAVTSDGSRHIGPFVRFGVCFSKLASAL